MSQHNFYQFNTNEHPFFKHKKQPKVKKVYDNKKKIKLTVWWTIGNVIFLALYYYFVLPPLNFHSGSSWFFIIMAYVLFLIEYMSVNQIHEFKKINKWLLSPLIIIISGIFLLNLFFTPIFQAKTFASRIQVETVGFEEIPDFDPQQTALIDRESAMIVGDKVMGNITDLVSQFDVSNEYTQISYDNSVYRVTPLVYSGLIKTFSNMGQGIPAYITVNSVSGEADIVQLEKGMKYTPSAILDKDLLRHIRFHYPTEIFGEPSFEIDDEGNPYYVCTTYTFKGVESVRSVTGVILVNAVTGETHKYKLGEEPTWVDRIFPESLVTEQLNGYGTYQNGFFNSIIGQKGVVVTSEGYNYLSKNGDIWLYTGITSVNSDASNLGFYLVNLRTHQAQQITVASANELAAMETAQGEVMNYGYRATFPTLVKVNNRPYYLLSLKDQANLVKMYALIDAQNYTQVYVTKASDDVEACLNDLIQQAGGSSEPSLGSEEVTFTINSFQQIQIDGTTYYYIVDQSNYVYKAEFSDEFALKLLTMQVGDVLSCTISTNDGIPSILKIN